MEGYWRTTVFTVRACERHDLDRIVYPVAFCLRQYLELALKDAIATTYRVAHEPSRFPRTHSLKVLWAELTRRLREINPDVIPSLDVVGACVEKFHAVDPSGEGFRYPQLCDGRDSLDRQITTINVRQLVEQMEPVHATLETLDWYLSRLVESADEIATEHAGHPSPRRHRI